MKNINPEKGQAPLSLILEALNQTVPYIPPLKPSGDVVAQGFPADYRQSLVLATFGNFGNPDLGIRVYGEMPGNFYPIQQKALAIPQVPLYDTPLMIGVPPSKPVAQARAIVSPDSLDSIVANPGPKNPLALLDKGQLNQPYQRMLKTMGGIPTKSLLQELADKSYKR